MIWAYIQAVAALIGTIIAIADVIARKPWNAAEHAVWALAFALSAVGAFCGFKIPPG